MKVNLGIVGLYVGPKFFMLVFVLVICFLNVNGQSLQDISSIKVDDLSDEQIQLLVERAKEAGLSENELIQMAQIRGVPQEEIEKLRERLESMDLKISSSRTATSASTRKPRKQSNLNEITQGILVPRSEVGDRTEAVDYFGMDLFYSKDRRLTFEPNLNMPTPQNYIIGPGDMIYVDVYGQSENYYEATVTPEGNLILENIGPINISGLSIEEATQVIKNRLSRYYTGMTGASPNTFMQVSLGNVRTIQVNLVGELRLPGTFTLSAFSTVFNALYAAGGPNANGTMRNIQLIRQNKVIAEIDVYDFLTKGNTGINLHLQDQDIIMVPPFEGRVEVRGEVKRPRIFEVKEGETFRDILGFAGGFTDEAFRERVNVTRITSKERSVSDIFQNQFSMFLVKGGDKYEIGKVLDRYTNRVQIKGAVFREGNYAYHEGLTLSQLIKNAEGVRGEAYLNRVTVLRTNEDLTTRLIQVNYQEIRSGKKDDLPLKPEDVVRVPSIYELSEEFYVRISGEVLHPGVYPYSEGMSAEDLILLAGGLREAASLADIEIARRATDPEGRDFSQILPVNVQLDLGKSMHPTVLKPFDNLVVRRKTNFVLEKMVQVEGQVKAPGEFAVRHAEERISDIIERAGGLTRFAYTKGATLIRRTEFYQTESEKIRRERNLQDLLERLNLDFLEPTESQSRLIERLSRYLISEEEDVRGTTEEKIIDARTGVLSEIAEARVGIGPIKIKETEAIAIDLDAILKNPGSRFDLILEEGDIISIPRQLQTVRLRGDVIYPTTVRYENFRGIHYYINRAGGFDNRAKRKRTYVVYANGEVSRTKNFVVFNIYPKIEPGSEIIVPTKGPKVPIRPGDLVGITTGVATIALLITQIFN
ncbi:SLBB domain-containing protein [Negadavirga shengliensis]|uniref:SLBB domain-containing protein n=2 Tax=Negadavirga shengliensis TaxID=1389218 RepID=A0ABV9SXN7_9BACT